MTGFRFVDEHQAECRVTSLGKLIAIGIATSSRGEITLSEGTLDMLGLN